MHRITGHIWLFILLWSQSLAADVSADHCPGSDLSRTQLHAFSEAMPPKRDLQDLALQLRYCLGAADPVLRDELAFGLLSKWMREGLLDTATRVQLFSTLTGDIAARNSMGSDLYLPFALITLAEVLRTDRIAEFLTDTQREKAIVVVSGYLSSLSDYRGFSADTGWRHSVAHGADVYLQLGLNEKVSAGQITVMADSLAGLINPPALHFYHYSEPQRLARAIAYLMIRKAVSTTYWLNWLDAVASPAPFTSWQAVFSSNPGLAKRHNVRAFLLELNQMVANSSNERLTEIRQAVEQLLADTA